MSGPDSPPRDTHSKAAQAAPPRRRGWSETELSGRPPHGGAPTRAEGTPAKKPTVNSSPEIKSRSNAKPVPRRRQGREPVTPKPAQLPDTMRQPRSLAAKRTGFRQPSDRRPPALISRGERSLFGFLVTAVLAMSIFLVRYRERVDAHFQARAAVVPLSAAATGTRSGPLQLFLANDDTGALEQRSLDFPLPEDPNMRARLVLEKLLAENAAPGSAHPLKAAPPGVSGVDEVFLSLAPGGHGLLAVVDLTSSFVRTHPSGMEPETLTLLSMIATLHANLPAVTEVHFLVDGEPRATLAGHADLTRTYLASAAQMTPGETFHTEKGTGP